MASQQVIVYLHGFNSSPASDKAVQFSQFIEKHYPNIILIMPQLSVTPNEAIQQIEAEINSVSARFDKLSLGFVGSSLGGFYSTYLAHYMQAKAVLINPAVKPHLLIDQLIGEYQNPYTQEKVSVTSEYGLELETLEVTSQVDTSNVWVLLQKDDETLDYRLAIKAYKNARMTLEPLGNHSFVGFNRYLNSIVEFLF